MNSAYRNDQLKDGEHFRSLLLFQTLFPDVVNLLKDFLSQNILFIIFHLSNLPILSTQCTIFYDGQIQGLGRK